MSGRRETERFEWRFDPVPPSGSRRGGIPVSYVFDTDLRTFVREVLQNSHDQRTRTAIDEGLPVEVDFDLIKLDQGHLDRFLEAARWQDLRPHLLASTAGNLTGGRIEQTVADIEDSGSLTILRISDRNTTGLTGGEDDHGRNYNALVRDVLVTTEEKTTKGGSHGLGKAVLWSFSGAATVLFSSVAPHPDRDGLGLRLVGRVDLPFHKTDSGKWDGPGWLGAVDPAAPRAISAWDASTLAADLQLHRDPEAGTGTSILIVGFDPPDPDDTGSVLLERIAEEASLNFWPAIASGSLRVRTRSIHNDDVRVERLAEAGSVVAPFIAASEDPEPTAKAPEPGNVAMAAVPIRVPGKPGTDRVPPVPETEASAELRVIAADLTHAEHPLRNRVALIRGAGMVVEYMRPSREPVGGLGFFGVLRAGEASGNTEEDRTLEEFLRASEPPAHNSWKGNTNRVRNEYKKGGQARLNEFFAAIGSAIIAMCDVAAPPGSDGPDRLKRLFQLKSTGAGPIRQSFKAHFGDGVKDGERWILPAGIKRTKGDGAWRAVVHVLLDGESGRGLKLPLLGLDLHGGGEATVTGNEAVISLPAAVDETTFTVRASVGDLDGDLSDRTRVRLSVRAKGVRGA